MVPARPAADPPVGVVDRRPMADLLRFRPGRALMTAGSLERTPRPWPAETSGAVQGRGSVVLVYGEAGIGKTSLVRAFARGGGD